MFTGPIITLNSNNNSSKNASERAAFAAHLHASAQKTLANDSHTVELNAVPIRFRDEPGAAPVTLTIDVSALQTTLDHATAMGASVVSRSDSEATIRDSQNVVWILRENPHQEPVDEKLRYRIGADIGVDDPDTEIAFITKALGGTLKGDVKRSADGKSVMHSVVHLASGAVYVASKMGPGTPPAGTPRIMISLTVDKDEATVVEQNASKHGAQILLPVGMQFWGALFGCFADPAGQVWAISEFNENVTNPTDDTGIAIRAFDGVSVIGVQLRDVLDTEMASAVPKAMAEINAAKDSTDGAKANIKFAGPSIAMYTNMVLSPMKFDFVIGFPVSADVDRSFKHGNVAIFEFPGLKEALYARHVGQYKELSSAYRRLNEYAGCQGLKMRFPTYERYLCVPGADSEPITEIFSDMEKASDSSSSCAGESCSIKDQEKCAKNDTACSLRSIPGVVALGKIYKAVPQMQLGEVITKAFGELWATAHGPEAAAHRVKVAGSQTVQYLGMPSEGERAFDIIVGLPIDPSVDRKFAHNGFAVHDFPAIEDGLFHRHVGPYSALSDVYSRLAQWGAAHGWSMGFPAYEVYLAPPKDSGEPKADPVTEVYTAKKHKH